ncbi:MAG: response regulator [Opitutales bacterium]|jgi:CheY-like chemotaxis protein
MIKGAKILLGDDSALARKLVAQSLRDLDVELFEATTGNGVIRAINEHKPALVILDISMPYPDGLTILRRLREDPEFKDTCVIMCSVENGPMERAEVGVLGVSGFLTKPLNMKLLREMVIETLDNLDAI